MNAEYLSPESCQNRVFLSFCWKVVQFATVICLSACSLNNQIVIKSDSGYQNKFLIKGFEFDFPPATGVHFVKLQGAAWVLRGDISGIAQAVVSKIKLHEDFHWPKAPGSKLNIKEITIHYMDGRWGGAVADPGIRLLMQFDGQYDGKVVDSCDPVEVIPPHQSQVNHGLFATRDQMRAMLQPVFEKLIADALEEAIFLSLVCLSQEVISQSRQ